MSITPSLPTGVKFDDLLDRLRILSWGAADILIAYARGLQPPYGFGKELKVLESADGPVSAADLAVNQWLLEGLNSSFPNANWELLSEETSKDQEDLGAPIKSEWLWVLDPLDGTKDFLNGTGEYAVHLALVQRQRTVLGVVLVPEREELWFGAIGHGSWCEQRNGLKTPVSFSKRRDINDLIIVSSRNHRDQRLDDLINSLSFADSKGVGSVGCKVATILRGESDLYISLSGKTAPKDWDMAAPEAILVAAGGSFTHADGRELLFNKGDLMQKGCLVASHGFTHSELCEKIHTSIKSIDPYASI